MRTQVVGDLGHPVHVVGAPSGEVEPVGDGALGHHAQVLVEDPPALGVGVGQGTAHRRGHRSRPSLRRISRSLACSRLSCSLARSVASVAGRTTKVRRAVIARAAANSRTTTHHVTTRPAPRGTWRGATGVSITMASAAGSGACTQAAPRSPGRSRRPRRRHRCAAQHQVGRTTAWLASQGSRPPLRAPRSPSRRRARPR